MKPNDVIIYYSKDGDMDINRILEFVKENNLTIGRRIEYFDSLDSTNDYIKRQIFNPNTFKLRYKEGHLVIAGAQTAGRGQKRRQFFSPVGGIYTSIVLTPKISKNANKGHIISILASLALSRVIDSYSGKNGLYTQIKWPNDVYLNGFKVCGMLTEARTQGNLQIVILGVGINVNSIITNSNVEKFLRVSPDSRPFSRRFCSLFQVLGYKINEVDLLIAFLAELDKMYKECFADALIFETENYLKALLEEYKSKMLFHKKEAKVILENKEYFAKINGISDDFKMIVEEDGGIFDLISDRAIIHF